MRGGGTYVRPFRERVQRLSLELMQFDVQIRDLRRTVRCGWTPASAGQDRQHTDEGIERAAGEFLSARRTSCAPPARPSRPACAARSESLSIEDIYRDRQRLVDEVRALVAPTSERMGLTILSSILLSGDKQGYIEALGRPRGPGRRDAIRGEGGGGARPRPPAAPTSPSSRSRRDYEIEKSHFRSEGMRVGRGGPLLRAAEGDLEPAGPRRAARRGDHRARRRSS